MVLFDDVGPVIELVESAEILRAVIHREGCSGLQRGNAEISQPPNTCGSRRYSSQQAMARADRQFDHVNEHGSMPDIKR